MHFSSISIYTQKKGYQNTTKIVGALFDCPFVAIVSQGHRFGSLFSLSVVTLRASLSLVALHTGYNFWKEFILRFLKTPPFKNLKTLKFTGIIRDYSCYYCILEHSQRQISNSYGKLRPVVQNL